MASNLMRAIPRLGIAPAILMIVFLIKVLFPMLSDPDFYWHLKTGEYILEHAALPQGELFTYTHTGRPLIHSEWLFQVILFTVFKYLGFAGVSVLVAGLYTACWYVAFLTCRLVLDDEAKAIIITLFFCGTFGVVAPRPHLFTFLFFAVTLFLIAEFKYRSGLQRMWLFPPMMLIWANMHGGFFLGLVLMGLFVGSEWVQWLLRGGADSNLQRRLYVLTAIAVTALLATAVNPDFIRLWIYPIEHILISGGTDFIAEWKSPNFHIALLQYFLLTVVAFWIGAVYAKRRPDLTEIAIPLVFVTGAFYSVRNVPIAAFAMSAFFAVFLNSFLTLTSESEGAGSGATGQLARPARPPLAVHRLSKLIKAANRQVGKEETWLNWALVGLAGLAVVLIYPSHQRRLQDELDQLLPVKAADFVLSQGITGRMFNTYHHGGYLIYRLYPKEQVFIYPRTDFLRPKFLEEYIGIYSGSPNWKTLFGKYRFDYVICESGAPVRQLLLEGREYRLVFDDKLHSVLLRDETRFQPIIRQYEMAPAGGT